MKKIIVNNNTEIAVIEGDQCISKWVEETGRLDHDQNALPFILPHIKQGDTVLDVGSYISDHTIAYAKLAGETGMVHAFEPSKEAFECGVFNMKGYQNTTVHNVAVGAKPGKTSLTKVEGNEGMNYQTTGSDVEVITIDSLKLTKCDFIKIDVEGYELDVLKGAKKTISTYKPVLVIEINTETLDRTGTKREAIYTWLDKAGYTYENIYKSFGQDLDEPQMDIICKHEG